MLHRQTVCYGTSNPASGGDNGWGRSCGGGILALAGLALLAIALLEAGHVALAHLSIARKEGFEVLRLHHRRDLDAVLGLAGAVRRAHQQGRGCGVGRALRARCARVPASVDRHRTGLGGAGIGGD